MNMLQMHFLKLLLWDTYEEETIKKVTICDLSFLLTLIIDFITFWKLFSIFGCSKRKCT